MKYSIVIPTYNRCDDLLKPCVESVLKYTDMTDVELIISANGCTDNTQDYLNWLSAQFNMLGFSKHLKVVWNNEPLGYPKATNEGIKCATADKIILLNNDAILTEQAKNTWINMLDKPFNDEYRCGISCIIKEHCEFADKDFAIFFCVMIHRKVFDAIGLLNEEYGVGSGEDTEFSIEATYAGFKVLECLPKTYSNEKYLYTGNFPIYHRGEATVHDPSLVKDWNFVFHMNSLKLAKKYNLEKYRFLLTNNYERSVILKGDPKLPHLALERARYTWAGQRVLGTKVLEIGCTTGYGVEYLPMNIDYTGVDYDRTIIEVAKEQNWGTQYKFVYADINLYNLEFYDTIIAFEIIEHLDNGKELVQRLKQHCRRLIFSVPYQEPPGYYGIHHRLHNLSEHDFPGFKYMFLRPDGTIQNTPGPVELGKSHLNLMLCEYDS